MSKVGSKVGVKLSDFKSVHVMVFATPGEPRLPTMGTNRSAALNVAGCDAVTWHLKRHLHGFVVVKGW